ncbi:MAG: AEC family transporter [Clostridia bacterium]|nr:AEC family transporter [Clostridia bacterium]
MSLSFLDVLLTVVSLVILMIPGFIFAKTKLLGETGDKVLSNLVLYGCQSMLMIMGFQKTGYRSEIALNMLIVFGLALAVHLIMIGIVYLVIRNKDGEEKRKVARCASVFSNCGYMGIPFLTMLFGNNGEILIYASMVIAVFNIFNWTFGVYMITENKSDISIKKIILNPVIICIVIGMITFFVAKTPLVDLAEQGSIIDKILELLIKAINFLAEMVTPLSMIVIGMRLANVKPKALFLDKWAYFTSLLKLIVMSLVSMLVVGFLPVSETIKYAVFFTLSMPSATGTVMFAVRFGGDSDSASVFVLLSTVLSVITIPLMFLLFNGVILAI